MKRIVLLLALGFALESSAAPKNLAKEAQALEQAATTESDPQKAADMRRSSCDKWQEAYNADSKPEYLLSIGLCRAKVQDLDEAEEAFRLFLVKAPANHKGRPVAEQSLEQVVAEQKALRESTPPALALTAPIPIEETKSQWKRRTIFVGGSLAGLGIVGGAIAFGVARSQSEFSRGTVIAVEQ